MIPAKLHNAIRRQPFDITSPKKDPEQVLPVKKCGIRR